MIMFGPRELPIGRMSLLQSVPSVFPALLTLFLVVGAFLTYAVFSQDEKKSFSDYVLQFALPWLSLAGILFIPNVFTSYPSFEAALWTWPFVAFCALAAGIIAFGYRSGQMERLPGMLTSLGIAGTFFGIFVALIPFVGDESAGLAIRDPENIQSLLGGVSLSMTTSLVGIVLALWYRALTGVFKERMDPAATLLQIASEQRDLLRSQTEVLHAQHELFLEQRSEDAERLGLIQKMSEHHERWGERLETIEGGVGDVAGSLEVSCGLQEDSLKEQRAMNANLQDALEQLAEHSTEAIVNALREIVERYEDHVQEQLGESFLALKESADNLSRWQALHLEEVRAAHKSMEEAAGLIDLLQDVAAAHERMAEYSTLVLERMNTALDTLRGAGEALEEQAETVQQGVVAAFESAVRDHQERTLTTHEALIGEYASKLTAATDGAIRGVGQGLDEAVLHGLKPVHGAQEKANEAQQELLEAFADLHRLVGTLRGGIDQYAAGLSEDVRAFADQRSDLSAQMGQLTRTHVERLAKALAGIHNVYHEEFKRVNGRLESHEAALTDPARGSSTNGFRRGRA